MLGGIGLLTSGLMFLLNRISTVDSPTTERAAADYASVPPPPALRMEKPLPPILLPTDHAAPAPLHFSYLARTVAFSVYMSVFMVIGLPLRYLRPLFENWSAGELGRFNTVLEIVLYLPVVFIALWTLRHIAAAERSTHALRPGGKPSRRWA